MELELGDDAVVPAPPADLVKVTGDESDGVVNRCAACDNVPWAKLCLYT